MSTVKANRVNKIRRNIRKGVEWLNANHAGWFNKIDLERLNMRMTSNCICGQLGLVGQPTVTNQYETEPWLGSYLEFDTGLGFHFYGDSSISTPEWKKVIVKLQQEERDQLFNAVVDGIVGQKCEKSVDPHTQGCMYRGPNGLKCAAGHIIPDSVYRPEWEGKSVNRGIENDPNFPVSYFTKKYNADTIAMMDRMQSAHDSHLVACGTVTLLNSGKVSWASEMLKQYEKYSINAPIAKAKLETIIAVC